MTLKRELKLQSKALKFERDFLHSDKASILRSISPLAKYLPILVASMKEADSSKALLLGLTASMEGITEGESKLALFSKDLKKLSIGLSYGLIAIFAQDPMSYRDEGEEAEAEAKIEIKCRLFSQLIRGGIVNLIGLLSLAEENAKNESKEEALKYEEASGNIAKNHKGAPSFFLQLLLRSLFASGLMHTHFKAMAESMSLGSEDKNSGADLASTALELVAMLTILIAFKKGNGAADEGLYESMSDRLINHMSVLEKRWNSLISMGRLENISLALPIRAFFAESKELLAQGKYELFSSKIEQLGQSVGLSMAKLEQDMKTAKRFYKSLNESFKDSDHVKENSMMLIG